MTDFPYFLGRTKNRWTLIILVFRSADMAICAFLTEKLRHLGRPLHVRSLHLTPHMSSTSIEYRQNHPLDPLEVVSVFDSSGINRPTNDLPRIARMFAAPCLVISAWASGKLIGVCRSLTDYAYCCYLSDLAVAKEYQRYGVGKELIRQTRQAIGNEASLVLLSAPDAMSYYPSLGFEQANNAFVIKRTQ